LGQLDVDRPGERVPLDVGVVAQLVGEFIAEGPAVGVQPLEVARTELDGEVVRHQPAVPGQDPRGVVDLTLERRRQLDRLDVALERAREDTAHNAFQTSLEALQRSHASSSTVGTPKVSTGASGHTGYDDRSYREVRPNPQCEAPAEPVLLFFLVAGE